MASISQDLQVFSKAMDLRVQKHQVLASNIANADTPNYKARDFSFEKAMQAASDARSGVCLRTTHQGHIAGGNGTAMNNLLAYRQETQSAVDGNTVDMDVERSAMSENAIQYQILSQLVSNTFSSFKAAMGSTQS